MPQKKIPKKRGIVILLDALGASGYSDNKIRRFLAARTKLNDAMIQTAELVGDIFDLSETMTFTFGDTLIVAFEINKKKNLENCIVGALYLISEYLYKSLKEGIIFRGAFSIGSYLADPETNTIMGDAVSDAAAWYEKAEWSGLCGTPKTCSYLEIHISEHNLNALLFIKYPVPLKNKATIDLYSVSIASYFLSDKRVKKGKERIALLEYLIKHPMPYGTEEKYKNTVDFFDFALAKIKANHSNNQDDDVGVSS